MPVHATDPSRTRYQLQESISKREIRALVANPRLEVLQFSEPVEAESWKLLAARLFRRRPDVQLRAYGFYGETLDLGFLDLLGSLRSFSADCLTQVAGLESLARLANLRRLGFEVLECDSFEFLSELPAEMEWLALGGTRSKKPSLAPLERFVSLRELHLDGQQKQIGVLASLAHLHTATLRSVSVADLEFLRPLAKLRSLAIKLGGSKNLAALAGHESLRYLEVWQVRGLSDLGPVGDLPGLQFLALQSLPQVRQLPDLSGCGELRRIHLDNMAGLSDLAALGTAPALEELIHWNAKGFEPQDYLGVLRSPAFRRALVGFGSDAKSSRFEELVEAHGKELYRESDFIYR